MRAGLLAGCLALSACMSTPPFERPALETPERYTAESLGSVSLETGADVGMGWWNRFGSSELDAVVAAALAGNRDLAAAQASLQQAQELAAAQHGYRLPSAELAAGGGRQKYGAAFLGSNAGAFPPFTYYTVGLNVSYLLDYAGGTRSAIEQSVAQAEVQHHRVEAARLSLIGNVVLEVMEIASAQEQLEAIQSIVEEDQRNVDLVHKALDAGSVARLDLLTAQSQLADDETQLPPLRQRVSAAQHALAVLVGKPPATFTAPDLDLSSFTLPQNVPVSIPSELARRRPDILADEARLHAATAAVGVANANLYPQIKITGSLSLQAISASDLFRSDANAFGLVGNLTAPIFNGGRLRAEKRATVAALQSALATYQQTVLTAFGQIADLLTALEHDAEQRSAQQKALDVAQTNVSMARESFSVGNSGVLQVLDAQRLAQRARIGVVRARAQSLQDTVELMAALAGESPAQAPETSAAR